MGNNSINFNKANIQEKCEDVKVVKGRTDNTMAKRKRGQTIQWPKEKKRQKGKQWSTKQKY
jgi:hypothetical protein